MPEIYYLKVLCSLVVILLICIMANLDRLILGYLYPLTDVVVIISCSTIFISLTIVIIISPTSLLYII